MDSASASHSPIINAKRKLSKNVKRESISISIFRENDLHNLTGNSCLMRFKSDSGQKLSMNYEKRLCGSLFHKTREKTKLLKLILSDDWRVADAFKLLVSSVATLFGSQIECCCI